MKIEEGIYLDYDDVLIRPKRSELSSRRDVDIERGYKFKYSKHEWNGAPIISANMDTVTTFESADIMMQNSMLGCLHKFYSSDELIKYFSENDNRKEYIIPSFGSSDKEFIKAKTVYSNVKLKWLCLDIANGYSNHFSDMVKKYRDYYGDEITIIAGNVATREMSEQLILDGTDVVKIGLGNGAHCFVSGTLVKTESGDIPIENIKPGDIVISHTNNKRKVINTFVKKTNRTINIKTKDSNINCTENHKFYVVDKKHKNIINEHNLDSFAFWISAEELDEEKHLLVKKT